jgi:GAF domain-containing protein
MLTDGACWPTGIGSERVETSSTAGPVTEPAPGAPTDGAATRLTVPADQGPSTGEIDAAARIVAGADTEDGLEAYVSTLEELTGMLLEDASLEQLLQHVLELTSRAVETSAAVSVTIVGDDGGYQTVAASSSEAVGLDELQYELREGPCIDALEHARENLLLDLRSEGSFPRFRARAREAGFGSILAVPLLAGGIPVGALNVFAAETDGFGEQDVLLARRIAAPAAATLANAKAYRRVARLSEQLHQALESRAVIEQAKGVLVAQRRCTPEEAFDLLRSTSQRSNRKLRVVAASVVANSVTSPPGVEPVSSHSS